MSNDQGYNGWTNHATWCVNLWLSNDQGTYAEVNDLIACLFHDDASVCDMADRLRDYVEELAELTCPGVIEGASFVSDLFGSVLHDVEWNEVAASWLNDLELMPTTGFTTRDGETGTVFLPADEDADWTGKRQYMTTNGVTVYLFADELNPEVSH